MQDEEEASAKTPVAETIATKESATAKSDDARASGEIEKKAKAHG